MQLVLASTGETFDMPAIVGELVEPKLQDVMRLITNAYLMGRGEKCIRLLQDGWMPIDKEEWMCIPSAATILVVTAKIAPVSSSPASPPGSAGDAAAASEGPAVAADPAAASSAVPVGSTDKPSSPSRRGGQHPRLSARGSEVYSLPASRLREYIEQTMGTGSSTAEDGGPASSSPSPATPVSGESNAAAAAAFPATHATPAKVHESVPPQALALASAICRDQGRMLMACMKELLADQAAEADERLAALAAAKEQQASAAASATAAAVMTEEEETDHMTMLLLSHIPNEQIAQMAEFGFSFQASARALLQCRLIIESAVSHILSSNMDTLELPFSRAELNLFSSWYLAPPPSAGGAAGGGGGGRAAAAAAAAASGAGRSRPAECQQLLDMGFAPSQVRRALRGADGNVSEACAALLGDPAALQRVEQRNVELLWLDPIEDAVAAGSLPATDVLEFVEALVPNPQAVLTLWYTHNPHFRRLCELFSASRATTSSASPNR